jgi:hypothetical protein
VAGFFCGGDFCVFAFFVSAAHARATIAMLSNPAAAIFNFRFMRYLVLDQVSENCRNQEVVCWLRLLAMAS